MRHITMFSAGNKSNNDRKLNNITLTKKEINLMQHAQRCDLSSMSAIDWHDMYILSVWMPERMTRRAERTITVVFLNLRKGEKMTTGLKQIMSLVGFVSRIPAL